MPTTVNSRYSNFISNYINYHNYQAHKHGNIAYDLRRLKQAMQEHRDLQVPDSLMQLIDHTLAMEARIKSKEGKDTALVRTYHQNHEDIVKGLEASVQKNSFMDLFKIVNQREEWDIIDRLALSGFQKDFASTFPHSMHWNKAISHCRTRYYRKP